MPTMPHEGLVKLFENQPELAPELLRDALGVDLPPYQEARISSESLNQLDVVERTADLVILLVVGKAVLAIVVEAQLRVKPDKLDVWASYLTAARAKFKCDACVLVITPSESVAKWARKGTQLGPGNHFYPLVLGPALVPIVDEDPRAIADPELAVLSVMAHGRDPKVGARVAHAAWVATRGLDPARQLLYSDLIFASISEATRQRLQELLMASGNYVYQSDFAKTHQAAGRAEGKAEGKAESVLRVLAARRLSVSDEQRDRIAACADVAQLDTWLERAVTVASADAVFED